MRKIALILALALFVLTFTACVANDPEPEQEPEVVTPVTLPATLDPDPEEDEEAEPEDEEVEAEPEPAASGDDDEAYAIIVAMGAALENITSIEMSVEAYIEMEMMGEFMAMAMYMEVQQIINSPTDIEMAMAMIVDMGEFGMMESSIYLVDGYLFQDAMGMQFRMPISLEEMLAMTDVGMSFDFPRASISESIITPVGNNTQVEFMLDGAMLEDMLMDLVGGMMEGMGLEGMTFTFGDVYYMVLVGPDNLSIEEHVVFDMEMNFMGETIFAHMDMAAFDISYNTLTHLNFPANLADFPEMAF